MAEARSSSADRRSDRRAATAPASPATRPSPNPRWAAPLVFPLALIGLGLSIYLTVVHYDTSIKLVCSDKGAINCAKVTTSSQSEIFGVIPVAVAGLAYYVVMVALTSPWAWRAADPRIGWVRLAGAVSGIGMVCYLVFVEAVQLKAICLYCTGVHIITFLMFLTILAAYLLRPLDLTEG